MSYEESLIQLVDQRIRMNQQQTVALGTCVERLAAGPGCTVLFDGSTVAVPVKVLGHVMLVPGQRCALKRIGTEWIVEGAFDGPALGHATRMGTSGTISTTSATYVDCAALPAFTFVKYRDSTIARVYMSHGGFTDTIQTGGRWGLRITQTDGDIPFTAQDFDGPSIYWSGALPLGVHLYASTVWEKTSNFPAGTYTCQLRWRRSFQNGGATGSVETNSLDNHAVSIQEVVSHSARSI